MAFDGIVVFGVVSYESSLSLGEVLDVKN